MSHSYGIEAEAGYQVSGPWRLGAGYTAFKLNVERVAGSLDVTSEGQGGDSPRQQAFVRSALSLAHGLALDLTTRYVGNLPNQRLPAYATGDARLGWQPTDRIELEVVGRDLFAPQHAEFGTPASRREVQRSIHGKATCRF